MEGGDLERPEKFGGGVHTGVSHHNMHTRTDAHTLTTIQLTDERLESGREKKQTPTNPAHLPINPDSNHDFNISSLLHWTPPPDPHLTSTHAHTHKRRRQTHTGYLTNSTTKRKGVNFLQGAAVVLSPLTLSPHARARTRTTPLTHTRMQTTQTRSHDHENSHAIKKNVEKKKPPVRQE